MHLIVINGSGKDAKALFFVGVRDVGKCEPVGNKYFSLRSLPGRQRSGNPYRLHWRFFLTITGQFLQSGISTKYAQAKGMLYSPTRQVYLAK